MKTKLLKKLRRKSEKDIKLYRERSTGHYIIVQKCWSWDSSTYFDEVFRTEARYYAYAKEKLVSLRRKFVLECLGKKTIEL